MFSFLQVFCYAMITPYYLNTKHLSKHAQLHKTRTIEWNIWILMKYFMRVQMFHSILCFFNKKVRDKLYVKKSNNF